MEDELERIKYVVNLYQTEEQKVKFLMRQVKWLIESRHLKGDSELIELDTSKGKKVLSAKGYSYELDTKTPEDIVGLMCELTNTPLKYTFIDVKKGEAQTEKNY